ncbi:MAG: branched-chain amino acid ABC transporter substrate-binding protein [Acidobacteria bacterium]|nr:branched-chain amino acid ABC transporter substrate-binding protein [Acidobacteriota bacterium]
MTGSGGPAAGVALLSALLSVGCAGDSAEVLVGLAAHPGGHQGAALAVEDLRQRGIRLRLREASRDESFTTGGGVVALAQAFDAAGVVAVVGHSASGATLSAAHILEQHGVPMVIPNATSPLLTGVGRWVFRICSNDRAQGELLARYARRAGYRRAGILYVLDDYGKGLAASFARAFAGQGGQVGLAVGYSSVVDRPDATLVAQFDALLRARPDVIFLAGRTRDLVELQGGDLLRNGPPVIGGDAAFSPLDLQGRPELFESMIVTVMLPPRSTAAGQFAERYRTRFGAAADNPSYACYDAVSLVGEAVREEGPTREGVRRFLRRLGRDRPPFQGLTGPIRFDDGGDAVDARFQVAQVRGGVLEALEP